MPHRNTYSDADHQQIRQLRAEGTSWTRIAHRMGRNRDSLRDYCMRNHVVEPDGERVKTEADDPVHYDSTKEPMRAFHPVSWGAIWNGLSWRP